MNVSSTYFSLINEAELAIVDGNYLKAKKKYDKALKNEEYSFTDDIANSLMVSDILEDSVSARILARELINRGLCPEFFEKFQTVSNLSFSSNIKKNSELKVELENLHNKDQDIRYSNVSNGKVREVDSLNYIEFLELISIYGYPNDLNIGNECSLNNKGISPKPTNELLLHFAQHKFPGIKNTLALLLKNHAINPYDYGYYMGPTGQDVPFYVSPIIIIDKKYYTNRLSKSKRNMVNRKRNLYGMASLEEQIKKIRFKLNNSTGLHFRFYTPIDQYNGLSEEIVKAYFVEFKL